MASANAMAISKPEHENCTLWYSYLTDGGSTWSDPVDITDEFLRDRTNTHTGSVSGLVSFADDLIEKERFIMYYDSPTALDKIYLSGLTQTSDLVFDVYADDVAEGVIPSTSIVSAKAQTITNHPRDTGNELITFSEASKTAFMVEVSGIDVYDGSDNTDSADGFDIILNGGFSDGTTTNQSEWLYQVNTLGASVVYIEDTTDNYHAEIELVHNLYFGEQAYSLQRIDKTYGYPQKYTLSVDIVKAEDSIISATNYPVGAIKIGSYHGDSDIYEHIIYESDDSTTLSFSFAVGGGTTLEYLSIGCFEDLGTSSGTSFLSFDNLVLTPVSGAVYVSDRLDHRAIFFGKELYQPDYNFNYGAGLDNSAKYGSNQTQTSNYQHKKNSTRNHSLTLEHQSDDLIDDCEYLDYQLGDGYCFYQRDATKTDPKYYFLANFSHATTRNDFYNYNSTSLVLQEAHEWL